MIILNYFVQITLQSEQLVGGTFLSAQLLATPPSPLLLTDKLWGLQHELIHDVLNLDPNQTTGDGGEHHLRRRPFDRFNFKRIFGCETLNIFEMLMETDTVVLKRSGCPCGDENKPLT